MYVSIRSRRTPDAPYSHFGLGFKIDIARSFVQPVSYCLPPAHLVSRRLQVRATRLKPKCAPPSTRRCRRPLVRHLLQQCPNSSSTPSRTSVLDVEELLPCCPTCAEDKLSLRHGSLHGPSCPVSLRTREKELPSRRVKTLWSIVLKKISKNPPRRHCPIILPIKNSYRKVSSPILHPIWTEWTPCRSVKFLFLTSLVSTQT